MGRKSHVSLREMTSEVLMERNAHPVSKSGDRNSLCPHYDGCLDYAVDHRWQCWNCSECPHNLEKEALSQAPIVKDENPLCYLPPRILRQISYWVD
jgi:hypothetical protein